MQFEDLHGPDIAAHALLQHLQSIHLPDCSLLTQFGDMRGLGGAAHALLQQAKLALGVIAKQPGSGTANTALVYHARKLLALHEGDLPYAVR